MDFDEYQTEAKKSDTTPFAPGSEEKLSFLVLGLVDEVGQLASLLKLFMRNDISSFSQKTQLLSRLGDALWYISAITDQLRIPFSELARDNLVFVRRRWLHEPKYLFSPEFEFLSESHERLPDLLEFSLERREADGLIKMRLSTPAHGQVGDIVDDNEYQEDYYRFHDVIHIGMMACFRWSPVMRKLLGLKRKSNNKTDRVEDGAKARDVEEALSRKIFRYLQDNEFLEHATAVDTSFLRELRAFEDRREVQWINENQWERLMFQSARVIRELIKHRQGIVVADIKNQEIQFKLQNS